MGLGTDAITVRLSDGAIRNHYLTLRGHVTFFPDDAVGGHTDAVPGRALTLFLDGVPEPISTDINGPKQRFRARGGIRAFVEHHGLRPGDTVTIRKRSLYEYDVGVGERRGGLDVRGLTSREAVLEAIAEFDSLGRSRFLAEHGFGQAKAWHILHDGKRYDSKAIYGVAYGYEHPEIGALTTDDFSGGEATVVRRLKDLGFDVVRSGSETPVTASRRAWLIRAGRGGKYEPLALDQNVAVLGWSDLGEVGAADRDELKRMIRENYGEERPASLASQAGQIYRFIHDVDMDDVVVLPLLSDPGHVAIGRIAGEYEYQDEDDFGPDARNTRAVDWLARRVPYERFDPDLREAFGQQGTVSEITKSDAAERLVATASGSDAGAIHLILKWAPDKEHETIQRHREVAEGESGAVWWGRIAKSAGTTGLASEWIGRLRDQIARGSETFVFLHSQAATWRTTLLAVTTDESDVDTRLIPDYYNPADPHSLWVKITDFEETDPAELTRDYVLARTGDPVTEGGLGNQGPLIVRKRTASVPSSYFILSQKAAGSVYDDLEGQRYAWTEQSSGAWKQLSNSPTAHFVYYRPGSADDETSKTYFGTGRLEGIEETEDEGRRRFTATIAEYRPFDVLVPFSEGPNRNAQTSIQPITRTEFERLMSQSFPDEPPGGILDVDALREFVKVRGLQLPENVLHQVVAALESGKHIILTGPPGTAKTTLAQAVGEAAREAGLCRGYVLTTATADWTTFETLGGLKPQQDQTLRFQEGHFLEAIENRQWLVVDELNRSNFDRALGQFFTVLSGQPVVLPYRRDGDEQGPIVLVPEGAASPIEGADVISVPNAWRIIATMNVFDKTLLFEMSFALMRRFAFIEVASPSPEVFSALIENEASGDLEAADLAKQLLPVRELKDLGPAVFMDIARYLAARRAGDATADDGQLLFEAFYGFLLPQFEGTDARQGDELFKRMGSLVSTSSLRERLRLTLNTVLGLDIQSRGPGDEDLQDEDDEEE